VRFLSFVLISLAGSSTILLASDAIKASQDLLLKGDYAQAEASLRDALKTGEADAPDRAAILNNLGDLLREEDRTAEARPCFESVLGLRDVPWIQRFSALMGLADLDRQDRAWTESVGFWNQAMAIAASHDARILESFAMRGLGVTWLDQGNTARAEPLLKRALNTTESDAGIPSYRLAVALDSLASLYRAEDKRSMAEELWTRELEIDRATLGDNHPQTALVMGHLAEAWSMDGDSERARRYSSQATGIMRRHFQANSVAVASALVNEAMVEQRAKQLDAAAARYAQALQILRTTTGSDEGAALVARLYAAVLAQLHRGREAKQVISEVTAFRSK